MLKKISWGLVVLFAMLGNPATSYAYLYNETANYPEADMELKIDKYSFTNRQRFFADVIINPNGTPVNAAGAYLSFDPDYLQVEKIDYTGSFCTLLPEELIDNEYGQVRVGCGTPRGQITGESKVVRISFLKVKEGWTKIDFNDDSLVLANDGFGTNLLSQFPTHRLYIDK